jgi:hypothetical protein
MTISRQRIYASLLSLGACVLLFRTFRMMFVENAFDILVSWVFSLLILESVIDLSCLITAMIWGITGDERRAALPLRLGAAAAILHALRVLIYVLGRTGPWVNFDVKPEHHSSYITNWFWVYFAATLSVLGVAGVFIIWRIRRRIMRRRTSL